MNSTYQQALQEWQTLFNDRLLSSSAATQKYGNNTLGLKCNIFAAIMPQSAIEVSQLVLIASKYHIPLYPISTGHNWGYGSALPIQDNAVIIDLSQMNQIISFDKELGLVTVEPGVTQGQLQEFLEKENLPYIVPVTGAGPSCSLIGNALDRGYGLTPIMDHFAAVTAVEGVLPNGDVYHSPLNDLGGQKIDKAFKWGVGPYLTGLFSQGNFAIITSMTFVLALKPQSQIAILIDVENDQQLFSFINPLREMLKEVGMNCGSFKLTNQHRLLNILEFIKTNKESDELLLENHIIANQLKKLNIPNSTWICTGAIYGNKNVVSSVKKVIKSKLNKHVKHIRLINPYFFEKFLKFISMIPFIKNHCFKYQFLMKLNEFLKLLSGYPNEIALPIAYAKCNMPIANHQPLNPDRDGCGIIWFTPLVPMTYSDVSVYIELSKKILIAYHFEPVITLSSVSDHCFDSAIPILFDKQNSQAIENAHQCYRALFAACKQQGFLPYRVPIAFMDLIIDAQITHWQLVKTIKQAIDPHAIFAPGRYS